MKASLLDLSLSLRIEGKRMHHNYLHITTPLRHMESSIYVLSKAKSIRKNIISLNASMSWVYSQEPRYLDLGLGLPTHLTLGVNQILPYYVLYTNVNAFGDVLHSFSLLLPSVNLPLFLEQEVSLQYELVHRYLD